TLEEISSHVFDVYRAALGKDFTVNGLLKASMHGVEILHWETLSQETKDWAWALGARTPEKMDMKNLSTVTVDACKEYFAGKEHSLTPEQAELLPELMYGLLTTMQQAGVQFGNNYRQAFLPGIRPLMHRYSWLVQAGKHFMNFDDYSFELNITENAIKAAQKPLIAAIEASGELGVKVGVYEDKNIYGIVKAKVESSFPYWSEPFRIAYQ
ncbi:MAG: hypothetical protein AABY26_00945, partial [Nanoarchaeota archaeon]